MATRTKNVSVMRFGPHQLATRLNSPVYKEGHLSVAEGTERCPYHEGTEDSRAWWLGRFDARMQAAIARGQPLR